MNNAGLRSPAVPSQRVAQTVRRSVRPSVGTELVSVPSMTERESEPAGRRQERKQQRASHPILFEARRVYRLRASKAKPAIFTKASTTTADTPLRQAYWRAGSPLGRSTYCSSMLLSLAAPRARLAWRLSGFVTNPREYCRRSWVIQEVLRRHASSRATVPCWQKRQQHGSTHGLWGFL